jgi:hypothetical protein
MSTVQFAHVRRSVVTDNFELRPASRGGYTVALEIPQSWLLAEIKVGESFDKKVGIAICSSDDNYSKKLGRELSSSRLKATRLTCVEVQEDKEGNRSIALSAGNGKVLLLRRLSSGKVFFLASVKEVVSE